MDRAKSLLRRKVFFGRQLDAWLAGSMLIGAILLAIFGAFLDAEGDTVSVINLVLLWILFPVAGILLSLLVHAHDPDGQ